MNVAESILVALDALWSHKLRSALTLLGIIVSVWTLVAVVSLVQGVNQYVGDKIAHLGSNTFSVGEFSLEEETDQALYRLAQKRNRPIQMDEFEYLRDHASLARQVAASVGNNTAVLRARNHSMTDVNARGVTANYIKLANFDVAEGRFLSPGDERQHASVAFVGPDIANQLFDGLDAVGQTLNVDGHDYQVIGLATAQGNVFGQSQDGFVMLPLGTYRDIYGTKDSLQVSIQAASSPLSDATADEARMLLRSFRHLRYADQDTFGIIGAASLLTLWNQLTGAIAAAMVGVSFIFLVVGGVVIMNIMLAAVTERTREIGIRKALGARRRDILSQFLVESAVLSTAGGVIGAGLAYGFTLLAGAVTPLPFSLPWAAVAAALFISTAVGLFFGIYPARKAAKLDPIAALRAEA